MTTIEPGLADGPAQRDRLRSPFRLQVQGGHQAVLITIGGTLDRHSIPDLLETLTATAGSRVVVLDIRDVRRISDEVVDALVRVNRTAGTRGQRLLILKDPAQPVGRLEIAAARARLEILAPDPGRPDTPGPNRDRTRRAG